MYYFGENFSIYFINKNYFKQWMHKPLSHACPDVRMGSGSPTVDFTGENFNTKMLIIRNMWRMMEM